MLGKVFKAYDIRATYPKPLNEKLSWQIGYAIAQYLVEQATNAGHDDPMMRNIAVGHDMRKSSPSLSKALRQGMRDFGAHVIDLGLVDTPFVSFAINHLGCCGGVQVTASHNPANYNGFKIGKIDAKPVGMTTGLDDVRRYAAMVDRDKLQPRHGREEERDLWAEYREHVLRFLDPMLVDGRKSLHVVVDASNGMAGTMLPKVFGEAKGLKITRLNFDNSTGEFEHEPNPLVESNLKQLQEKVRAVKADVGICFDGDADRCVAVDEAGHTIGCDILTAWLAQAMLRSHPGSAVAYDLRSSKAVPEAIVAAGGRPVRGRVGHVFMKQLLAETGACFGGELSGHFYFRDNFNADSGAIAFALLAGELARSKQPLSRLVAPFRTYAQSGEINFENEEPAGAIEALKAAWPDAKIDMLDGITIDNGSWWMNVRMSNTEPLLRLNLEARDAAAVKARVAEVAPHLGKRVAH
ncbi:MAG TPA: phosphomannomutase/phosphoglucomutase [Phycisphaerales bacterium]|nr:phosphomannomutase/phosphoglucomutase [Phycisphaerales bacterium]HMP37845.1 phosphomannomutase/phosphoglucomutase [Phycisphaerales bacterium]